MPFYIRTRQKPAKSFVVYVTMYNLDPYQINDASYMKNEEMMY